MACIVTGRSKAFLEDEVRPLVEQFLAEPGLARSQQETRVTHIEDGFVCLGTHVRTDRGKLLWTPAKKNVQAFLDTIRGIVKRHKQAITGNLIRQLNPVIRGWAQYHQHGVSKRTVAQVDHQHLYPPVAVGAAETPAALPPLDSGPGLSVRRREQFGVLWSHYAWPCDARCAPVPRIACADSSAH